MKVLVGAFNQEKALVRSFSVIVKLPTSRRFVSSCTEVGRARNMTWHMTEADMKKMRSGSRRMYLVITAKPPSNTRRLDPSTAAERLRVSVHTVRKPAGMMKTPGSRVLQF